MIREVHHRPSISTDWTVISQEFAAMRGDNKGTEKNAFLGSICYQRNKIGFHTGSSYTGSWNALGMAGQGHYHYSYGCQFIGSFQDGRFHGPGTLIYPMGQKLQGIWEKGKMVSYTFLNLDGLTHSFPWNYCKFPDRRFTVSYKHGLQPAGREFLTNQQPTRPMPSNMYDTGDGFFHAETDTITQARDPEVHYVDSDESLVMEEDEEEEKGEETEAQTEEFWAKKVTMVPKDRANYIRRHFRKGWDEATGYRPDLYPDWLTGRRTEMRVLEEKYAFPRRPRGVDVVGDTVTNLSVDLTESNEDVMPAGPENKLTIPRKEAYTKIIHT